MCLYSLLTLSAISTGFYIMTDFERESWLLLTIIMSTELCKSETWPDGHNKHCQLILLHLDVKYRNVIGRNGLTWHAIIIAVSFGSYVPGEHRCYVPGNIASMFPGNITSRAMTYYFQTWLVKIWLTTIFILMIFYEYVPTSCCKQIFYFDCCKINKKNNNIKNK